MPERENYPQLPASEILPNMIVYRPALPGNFLRLAAQPSPDPGKMAFEPVVKTPEGWKNVSGGIVLLDKSKILAVMEQI